MWRLFLKDICIETGPETGQKTQEKISRSYVNIKLGILHELYYRKLRLLSLTFYKETLIPWQLFLLSGGNDEFQENYILQTFGSESIYVKAIADRIVQLTATYISVASQIIVLRLLGEFAVVYRRTVSVSF